MSRLIPLTQGKYATVDDADFEYLNQWKWHYKPSGDNGYAVRKQYEGKGGNSKRGYYCRSIPMHRLIMDSPEGMDVDHINGVGLDNQRKNLRVCTHQENLQNSAHRSDNTSGYRGVTWDKKLKKWFVRCTANGVNHHVGYFLDVKEAALAYNVVAKKYYGEYARFNIV